MSLSWTDAPFEITTDPARADVAVIADFLATSYWAEGIPVATVAKSIQGSLCFSLFDGDRQIGFARVVSDRATFAYLADVFVHEGYRGQGLAKWLIQCVTQHPELQGLRRWMLATRDAHGLYARFGFRPLGHPEIFMERWDPEAYRRRR